MSLHGSYHPDDVTFLLKPVTLPAIDIEAKEALIQSGKRHYSEMLSPEVAPSPAYLAAYRQALAANGARLARHVNRVADGLAASGRRVLCSLARAGTPIGVLLARALRRRGIAAAHYSLSIVRGRGIDQVALAHVLARHGAGEIAFIDGWTGKGAIAAELRGPDGAPAAGLTPFLAVIADPAGRADLAATADDYVIPSGILGGIVSGLISRSVLGSAIGPGDFHGTVLLDHLALADVSCAFVETIDALARIDDALARTDDAAVPAGMAWPEPPWLPADNPRRAAACDALVARLAAQAGIADRNRIKPGIAEATRAVLRRKPGQLLLAEPTDPDLRHLVQLAKERDALITRLDDASIWRAVAIIAPAGEG